MSKQMSMGVLSKYSHILNADNNDSLPVLDTVETIGNVDTGMDTDNQGQAVGILAAGQEEDNNNSELDDDDEDNDIGKTAFQPRTDEDLAAFDNVTVEISLDDEQPGQSLILDWVNEVDKLRGRPIHNSKPTEHVDNMKNGDSVDLDSDDEDRYEQQQRKNNVKKQRRRNNAHEVGEYDYEDPFIDDDDDFFAEQLMFKPEISGYFVWRGVVPSVEVDPSAETSAGSEDVGDLADSSPEKAQGTTAAATTVSDDERRKSDMENLKISASQTTLLDSTNVSPVKPNTPSRKKKADNDGLIIRKK